ncbi:hypothetical protein [Amycolatopsis nigrescens]|nr:hypothetical protein [Amycolatopsis nigrescens]
MLLLIVIVELTVLCTVGFELAALAQGTSRMGDWSLSSPYPRRDRNSDRT